MTDALRAVANSVDLKSAQLHSLIRVLSLRTRPEDMTPDVWAAIDDLSGHLEAEISKLQNVISDLPDARAEAASKRKAVRR